MSTEENPADGAHPAPSRGKEIVRRYQDALNRNDMDAFALVVAEDINMPDILPNMPSGIEGAKQAHHLMLVGFPDFNVKIEDLIAEGDKVVARITMTGTHTGDFVGIPPTGNKVNFTGMYIARIANGKIVEHRGIEDSITLLQQLGVMPRAA